jgi:hypothetical protein
VNRRLLTLTGPVFTVLFIIIVFVLSSEGPGEGASGKQVLDFIDDNESQLFVGVFGGPLLAALIVVFFSHLSALARERGATGAGPTAMVGGAVLWSGGLLLSSWLELAGLAAADKDLEQVAQTVNVLIEANWLPFIGGIAVTLIGAGMTVLGSGLLPRWLGWVALVAGIIALAGPGGFLGFFVGPLFMLVAGIMLLMREEEPASLGAGAADV